MRPTVFLEGFFLLLAPGRAGCRRVGAATDADLAALEARMITISPTLALGHVDEPLVDGEPDAAHRNDGDRSVDCVGES
jgi:hypothetical protein